MSGPRSSLPASLPLGCRLIERGWLSANSVVFLDSDGSASVVDTGYVSHAAQTVSLLERAVDRAPLTRIINTHLHSDHCGGNAALQARWPGATITVPEGCRAAVEPWNEERLSYRATGQSCAPFNPNAFARAGDELRLAGEVWEVHAAPGHDPDAVMLFEPRSRSLISGDALWERRLAIIFPELNGEQGFDAASLVLDTIERLAPRIVLPGHGAAFRDVAGALAQSRQRLERFAREPQRHRDHAVRALVLYHMLEHRRRERSALQRWIAQTPIFQSAMTVASSGNQPMLTLAEGVVTSLLEDGILRVDGPFVMVPEDRT